MRKIKTTTKLLAVAMAVSLGILTIWAFNSGVNAKSMPACTRSCRAVFSFGMLGVTAQQTARFSVVNTNKCAVGRVCAPAQIDLRFVNSSGSPFTNVDGHPIGSSSVTLAADQSTFVDFTPPSGTAGRMQIRAEMPNCVGCGNGNGKGTVLATLEVFDTATGIANQDICL